MARKKEKSRNLEQRAAYWILGISGALGLLEVSGIFAGLDSHWLIGLVLLATIPAIFAAYRRWRVSSEPDRLQEVELGVSLIVASFLAVRAFGAFGVDGFPFVYLIVALLVTFQSRFGGALVVGTALIMTWAPDLMTDSAQVEWQILLTRSAFITVFGGLSAFIHGAEILERRIRHRREVQREKEDLLKQARELRLLSARHGDPVMNQEEKTELIARDAVAAVNHAIYLTVALLKNGLNAHTVVLLWFDVKGEFLQIKELFSDCDHITEGSFEPARGVVGGITRRREAVCLEQLKSGFRGIPYYSEPQNITSFAGIPVVENGHLRGVLCADRKGGPAFSADEIKLMEESASYLVDAIENQRHFAAMERSKHELTRFFESSRRLNGVLTSDQVYEVALSSADEIAPWEFAAVTLFNDDQHVVAAVDARDGFAHLKDLKESVFEFDGGLVSMAIKNRHYLPFGGVVRDSDVQLFAGSPSIQGLKSLLVMPLIVLDQTVGTFIVGHSNPNHYSRERREMLEVVCNQVAVTLQNARLYEQMETMATTDGLTGLANHRSFQQRLDETIARHRRTQRPFAILLTDIDHFKSVNDTHGHPIGDEVLRQVSKCFTDNLRETDLAARYGGEEFAMILEDTDLDAAMVTANRLRTEIKKLVYDSPLGSFSVTISIGLGFWPSDAEHKQALIDLTDQALYHSKHGGRDRVTAYSQMIRKAS